jgi:cytoskeletal protein CcmA (bactofilin family)
MVDIGFAFIGEDATLKGKVRKGGRFEVRGYFEGEIEAEHVVVHKGGRVFGTIKADSAEVHGLMQGVVGIKKLISISSTGEVAGKVHYGQLALKEGGHLAAEVRNVPPELVGDFNVVVRRGKSVRVTTEDITANDPDDKPEDLHFTVSQPRGGHIAFAAAPGTSIKDFTQAQLMAGTVLFVHDGSSDKRGGFNVQVRDKSGADSGAARAVTVDVM